MNAITVHEDAAPPEPPLGGCAPVLEESQAGLESVRLLAQALGGRPLRAEPRPGAQKDERTAEQRAIDTFLATFLATFQDLTRGHSRGPLFDGVAEPRAAD